MRKNLKEARQQAGMTQQEVADKLKISIRYYQNIEAGDRTGDFTIWDCLEDLFGIHQRILREISSNHHVQGDSQ
ncbi:MAG: helix-turn-helix domain-containing protein [Lachnospiraceae bacterium]